MITLDTVVHDHLQHLVYTITEKGLDRLANILIKIVIVIDIEADHKLKVRVAIHHTQDILDILNLINLVLYYIVLLLVVMITKEFPSQAWFLLAVSRRYQ